MSEPRYRHVLALLHGDRGCFRDVLARAVHAASSDRSRLTLAKTPEITRITQCLAMLPTAGAGSLELDGPARDELALAAEEIPSSIQLRTVVLRDDVGESLTELLRSGDYDLLVAGQSLLRRSRRVCRQVERHGNCVLAVAPHPLGAVELPEASELLPVRATNPPHRRGEA